MKKIVSTILSVAVVTSVCTTKTYAIGYNKVVDNDLGGKTTYVDTEHLEEYMEKLKSEMEEVKQKYEDRYEIHPWKGALMELSPIILASIFNVSLGFAMKIFNYIRFKNSLKINSASFSRSSDTSAASSREVSPTRVKFEPKGFWEDSSLSIFQTLLLSAISGFTYLLSLIKSNDYTPSTQSFEATNVWEKNGRILKKLTDAINDPDLTVRLYGAEIICEPSTFLDKIYKSCQVNSQERFFIKGCKRYDPVLAETIPKLGK